MNLIEYQRLLLQVPYGKRVQRSIYLFRAVDTSFGTELDSILSHAAQICGADNRYNVVKFRLDDLKLSFLSYPDFAEVAHPALREAITLDLASGKARKIDYSKNSNPPILHRKEALLPNDDPRHADLEALTQAEEASGLYQDTTKIGFRLNWERLLKEKGLMLQGHRLSQRADTVPAIYTESDVRIIDRHKTALARYDLSKPVKSLLEYGILREGISFFDYGCGQGTDVSGLQALGYDASGWDPVYRPDSSRVPADVVNLGYVLNVIEDPAERLEVLRAADSLARRVLVVSALIRRTADSSSTHSFSDGVLTGRNTFQKFYDQPELQQFVEDALERTAIPVALGVFLIFHDLAEQQDFISARTRRSQRWMETHSQLGLGRPKSKHGHVELYELHKCILDEFWKMMLEFGRLPEADEFPRFDELLRAVRSPKRAEKLFVERYGQESLTNTRENRRNELLVFLAMSNLRKTVPLHLLSKSLRSDVRSFFGSYRAALAEGRELLFSAGDSQTVQRACTETRLGWQDDQALYIHRTLMDQLSPILRVYVACASFLCGDLTQLDIIKLHKVSGKITFLAYDDFENEALPELRQRIKVNLKNRLVQVFDYEGSGQLLYLKERFVRSDHPEMERMRKVTATLHRFGLSEQIGLGPTKSQLIELLKSRGITGLDQLVEFSGMGESSEGCP